MSATVTTSSPATSATPTSSPQLVLSTAVPSATAGAPTASGTCRDTVGWLTCAFLMEVAKPFTSSWFPLQSQELPPQLQCQAPPSPARLCQAPRLQLCRQVNLHEPQPAMCWCCCCQGRCLVLEVAPSGVTHRCAGVPVTTSAAPTAPSAAFGTPVPSSTAGTPATAGESERAGHLIPRQAEHPAPWLPHDLICA